MPGDPARGAITVKAAPTQSQPAGDADEKVASEARRPGRGLANSGDLAASWPRTADNAGNHLSGVEQGLRSQMGIALGHARLGVPKKALDHVKRYALVHQEAGERVPQIVQKRARGLRPGR